MELAFPMHHTELVAIKADSAKHAVIKELVKR
jgi:hypothetical protein